MTKKPSVLIYSRPWNVEQMQFLADGVWGKDANIAIVSEHPKVDSSGLLKRFYSAYNTCDLNPKILTESEVVDIIQRCRLLRSLDVSKARHLIVAMECAIDQVLAEKSPSHVISLTIDSYIIDILCFLCAKRNIMFLGLVPSFLKNHFRITARGEYIDSRSLDGVDREAELQGLLAVDYKPDFLVKSNKAMQKQMWRLWSRNLIKPIWFWARRMISGDKYNYHQWASQIMAIKFWSWFPQKPQAISFEDLSARNFNKNIVYIPLQMSPEATVDYWSADVCWVDYEETLVKIIRDNKNSCIFVLKEHPNLIGYRDRGFYKRIEKEENCIFVNSGVHSNLLVDFTDSTLVCTGTVGFEAALRGKPVFSDSKPYYAPKDMCLPISNIGKKVNQPLTDSVDLMEHVLKGALRGRFLNDGTWTESNSDHVAWGKEMVNSIKEFLERSKDKG